MSEFKDLKFQRVIDPLVLYCEEVKCLFEQMKYREFDIDNIYKYAPYILSNPCTWFYVMVDLQHVIKGVLWAMAEPVQEVLIINFITVDPEYQDGKVIEKSIEFLWTEIEKTVLRPKIYWISKRHKALQKMGFTNTGKVMMEIRKET